MQHKCPHAGLVQTRRLKMEKGELVFNFRKARRKVTFSFGSKKTKRNKATSVTERKEVTS